MAIETVEYRVRRGDTLQNIVQIAGFPRRDWRRIYDAPYNRAFRSQHPDPDQIQAGDRLMLPRYNTRQVADIVRRIQMVERRLTLMNEAISEFEQAIPPLERQIQETQDLTERDLQRRVADIQRRADNLENLSNDAANECADIYSCIGGGLASQNLSNQARRLRTEASQLQRHIKKGEKAALKALASIRSRLRIFRRAQAETTTNVSRLRTLYRRAAQNPY